LGAPEENGGKGFEALEKFGVHFFGSDRVIKGGEGGRPETEGARPS